jgi:hypothetical protein
MRTFTSLIGLLVALSGCGSRSELPAFEAPDSGVGGDAAPALECFSDQVTVLAEGELSATALALDATHLYWAAPGSDCSTGKIRKMPKSGGAATTLASDQPNPRNVAVDESRVYFRDACGTGFLRSVPKAGGQLIDHGVQVGPSTDARVLGVDAENLYFNDYGVLRMPKNGGAQVVLDPDTFALALVADPGGVYWVGSDAGGYRVYAYHPGDAAPTQLATPTGTGYGLALDATSIYFSAHPGIWRLPRSGGDESLVVTAQAWKIAVDEANVYWTEGVVGSNCFIKKAPKTGGPVTEIAQCDGAYVDIVVDDRCVYWADLYDGVIVRAPK